MINGDMKAFVDTLFTGQDIEVLFREKHYFIHGYYVNYGTAEQYAHMEMIDYDNISDREDFIWAQDGTILSDLAAKFLQARIWDGMTFDEAEREIEWIG